MEVLLHLLVDALGLAIGLRVVRRGGRRFNSDEVPELRGELHDELRPAVGEVPLRKSVVAPDIPIVEPSGSDGVDVGGALVEVSTLAKGVHYHHDRIVAMGLWKLNHEVHRHRVPALRWDFGRMKFSDRKSSERLGAATQVASCDIPADVAGQLGPPEVPGDELQRFEASDMSGDFGVVVLL